jgi:hypothetical protein
MPVTDDTGPLPTAVTPDVPAGQTTQAVQDAAVSAVEDVVSHPGVASGAQVLQAAEAVAESPTVRSLETDLPPLIKETKAGWKTTEFWTGIAAALNDVISTLPPSDKIALTGLAGVYAVARGIAKNGIPFVSSPGAPQ